MTRAEEILNGFTKLNLGGDDNQEKIDSYNFHTIKISSALKAINIALNDTRNQTIIGKKAKLNLPASWDFPNLKDIIVEIVDIDDKDMCTVKVDGEEYPHKLGLKGELILIEE